MNTHSVSLAGTPLAERAVRPAGAVVGPLHDRPGRVRPRLVVAVLAFGGFVAALTHTLVLPLLPLLPDMLDASAFPAPAE